ncbi:MAG: hypothetical protein IJO20_06875 [Ruminococcus sp.]|nr:hypothetical protein [Ruminococcus sp.]
MKDESYIDDKMVLSKAKDTIYLSQKRFSTCYYGFLNEHQAQLIKDRIELSDDCLFWGGYEDAQRVLFCSNVKSKEEIPIVAIRFTYKKEFKLTHRDFLGSLMALGIKRETLGDILTFEGYSIVFVKADIAQYIMSEVTKIGRVGVSSTVQDIGEINFVPEYEMIDLTISSLRLDVLVSALCNLSRDKSQSLIKADLVSVNHRITDNVSAILKTRDVITIRKYGKFMFTEENGFSKKGKVRITVKHFR